MEQVVERVDELVDRIRDGLNAVVDFFNVETQIEYLGFEDDLSDAFPSR
ncbi:MAG: hypothetical protein ACOC38_09150 [Promethearchaeia archaeon]